jgi:thermitase
MKIKLILLLSLIPFYSLANEARGMLAKLKSGEVVRVTKDLNKSNIEYIEPNYIYTKFGRIMDIRDKLFSYQWALENRGLNSGSYDRRGLKGVDINAKDSWYNFSPQKKVRIAVIDSGVDYTHEDLQNQIMINQAELNGRPGVDDDGNGYIDDVRGYDFAENDADPMDKDGHGTHCAGIIGAEHNSLGIRGIINNVEILPLKFLDDEGKGETINAIRAIDYAIAANVDIISNSWGGGKYSRALLEAIERARDAGIIFVAAVGNSNQDLDKEPVYPAAYPVKNIIAVANINAYGRKAKSSNYGQKTVHVFAPGESILSTLPGNNYKRHSGTSMAAPLVAGTLGLLLSQEPDVTPAQAKQRLIDSSETNYSLSIFVQGGLVKSDKLLGY